MRSANSRTDGSNSPAINSPHAMPYSMSPCNWVRNGTGSLRSTATSMYGCSGKRSKRLARLSPATGHDKPENPLTQQAAHENVTVNKNTRQFRDKGSLTHEDA